MHPPAEPSSPHDDTRRTWYGRRKRIIAREVSTNPAARTSAGDAGDATGSEARATALGLLQSTDVIDPPAPLDGAPPESVIDPTAFGERHRKHSQNFAYRLTQISTGGSVFASLTAILAALLEDETLAQVLAAAACVLAVLAVRLVRSSRLAYRLRGYAAASAAVAVLALVLSILPNLFRDEPRSAPQPSSSPASAARQ